MTDEVDPRLVALGLVPAPAATPASPSNDWETAAPPKPSDWVVPAPPAAAPPSPPPPSPTPSVVMPGHKPLTVGDLFPGMGKFTGSAPANPPPAPPAPPPTYTPAPQSFAPPAPPPPAYTPPAYVPPAYTAPVAPPAPEAPVREAPPPLPPLVSAMPTVTKAVEAPPAIPTKKGKKEKPAKPQKEKAAKAAKAAKPAKPVVAKPEKVKPAPKPRFVLPPSGVLLRGPIVMGYPEQKLQITLEQLGFRIDGKEPIDVAWTDVREIKPRRGRVVVRTKGRPVAFGIPVDGVRCGRHARGRDRPRCHGQGGDRVGPRDATRLARGGTQADRSRAPRARRDRAESGDRRGAASRRGRPHPAEPADSDSHRPERFPHHDGYPVLRPQPPG